ncbi:hypothetical protein D3C71_1894900 [compost metagenome]
MVPITSVPRRAAGGKLRVPAVAAVTVGAFWAWAGKAAAASSKQLAANARDKGNGRQRCMVYIQWLRPRFYGFGHGAAPRWGNG